MAKPKKNTTAQTGSKTKQKAPAKSPPACTPTGHRKRKGSLDSAASASANVPAKRCKTGSDMRTDKLDGNESNEAHLAAPRTFAPRYPDPPSSDSEETPLAMDVDSMPDIETKDKAEPPSPPANPPDGSARSKIEWDTYTKRSVAYQAKNRKEEAARNANARQTRAVQEFSRMQLRQRATEKAERERETMVLVEEERKPPLKRMKKGALAAAVKQQTAMDADAIAELDGKTPGPSGIPRSLQITRKRTSEISADWKKRANKPPVSTPATQTCAINIDDDDGLGDNDIYDELPPASASPSASKKSGHSMVAVVRTSTPVLVKPRVKREPGQHIQLSKVSPSKPLAPHPKVKKEVEVEILDVDDQTCGPDLPLFARAQWIGRGMPTFLHYMLASTAPFSSELGKNTRFVKVAQECMDAAYPGNTYVVRENDGMFTKGLQRIIDRRSKIGRTGLDYVKSLLAPMSPADRIAYVRWGLNIFGPVFYSTPIPSDCTLTNPRDPNFPRLRGYGETDAFKKVFNVAVGDVLGKSQGSWGQALVGAFVLSGASVLRALRMWQTGEFIDLKTDKTNEFSATNIQLQDDISRIITAAKGLSAKAWGRIHTNAGTLPNGPPVPSAPQVLEGRQVAYVPESSPAPEDD